MATEVPLNQTSENAVIELINIDNDLYLSKADVVITNVRTNPNPTVGSDGMVRDTIATAVAVKGGNLKNNVDVTYHRLRADVIFSKVTTVIAPNHQVTTADLLPEINKMYTLQLQENDIIPAVIDLRNLPFTTEIVFKSNNPAWVGKFPVIIRKLPLNLAEHLLVRDLPIHRYPSGQTDLIQGPLYCYGADFTPYRSVLTGMTTESDPTVLMPVLNRIMAPDQWGDRPSQSPFNVNGSKVVYNGPVIDRYSTRTDKERVLVLLLSNNCNNIAGQLMLHYNVWG